MDYHDEKAALYYDSLYQCGLRYDIMYDINDSEDALKSFIDLYMQGIMTRLPIPKLCRWLGYIQGVLIERGYTTVEAERDFTRPLFRPLDFDE